MSKKCCDCQKLKPETDYYKDKSRYDGLDARCADCNKDRYRTLRSTTAYRGRKAKSAIKYREKYPEKQMAHRLARSIQLPAHCEHCGKTRVRLHRHHADYARPLEVTALCIECHENVHHRGLLI